MRILYDSKQPQFKTPFGTLTPGQVCTLHIHIPTSVLTTKVTCVFNHEDGSWAQNAVLAFQMKKGAYDVFHGAVFHPLPRPVFLLFRHRYTGRQLPPVQAGGRHQHGSRGSLAAELHPRRLHHPGLGEGRNHLSGFPRPFLRLRKDRCDREAEALHHPQKLVRRSGLEAYPRWAGAEQRLFRRQFPGHH